MKNETETQLPLPGSQSQSTESSSEAEARRVMEETLMAIRIDAEVKRVKDARKFAAMRTLGVTEEEEANMTQDQRELFNRLLKNLEKTSLTFQTPEEEGKFRARLRPCMENAFERAVALNAAGGVQDLKTKVRELQATVNRVVKEHSHPTANMNADLRPSALASAAAVSAIAALIMVDLA